MSTTQHRKDLIRTAASLSAYALIGVVGAAGLYWLLAGTRALFLALGAA